MSIFLSQSFYTFNTDLKDAILQQTTAKLAKEITNYFVLPRMSFHSYLQQTRTVELVRDWNRFDRTSVAGMVFLTQDDALIRSIKITRNGESISSDGATVTIQNQTAARYGVAGRQIEFSNPTVVPIEPLESTLNAEWRLELVNGAIEAKYLVPQWQNRPVNVPEVGNPLAVHSLLLEDRLTSMLRNVVSTEKHLAFFLSINHVFLASNEARPDQTFVAAVTNHIRTKTIGKDILDILSYYTRIESITDGVYPIGYLVVGIPHSDIFTEYNSTNIRAVIFGSCMGLLALGFKFYYSWSLVRPLHKMRTEMIQFSKSDIRNIDNSRFVNSPFTEVLQTQLYFERLVEVVKQKVQEIYFPDEKSDVIVLIRPSAMTSKPKFSKGDDPLDMEILETPIGRTLLVDQRSQYSRSMKSQSKIHTHSADSLDLDDDDDSIDISLVNGSSLTGPAARLHTKHMEISGANRIQFFGAEGKLLRQSARGQLMFARHINIDKPMGSHSVVVVEEPSLDVSSVLTSKGLFKSLGALSRRSQQHSADELKRSDIIVSGSVDSMAKRSNSSSFSLQRKQEESQSKELNQNQVVNTSVPLLTSVFRGRRESTFTTSTNETSQNSQEQLNDKKVFRKSVLTGGDFKIDESVETIESSSTRGDIGDSLQLYGGSSYLISPIQEELPNVQPLAPHQEIDEENSFHKTSEDHKEK